MDVEEAALGSLAKKVAAVERIPGKVSQAAFHGWGAGCTARESGPGGCGRLAQL